MKRLLAVCLLTLGAVFINPSRTHAQDSLCSADINQDNLVDLSDYSIIAINYFSASPAIPRADINSDGIVDLSDYSLLALNYLQTVNDCSGATGDILGKFSDATIIVAASNSMDATKADFVSDGKDDQEEIISALATLPASGGRVVLLEGSYSWFDEKDTAPVYRDNVTISGQGASTKIYLKSNVTPFGLRDVSEFTLKDIEIILSLGSAHTEEVIEFLALGQDEYNVYNSFENIAIRKPNETAGNYTAIRLYADNTAGWTPYHLNNFFKGILIERAKTGILLETAGTGGGWINGNKFEDIFVDGFETGVDFKQDSAGGFGASRNVFVNVKLQAKQYSKDGFKDIQKNGNVFIDCLVWDWGTASNPNYAWSVHPWGNGTYIQTTNTMGNTLSDLGEDTTIIEDGIINTRKLASDSIINVSAGAAKELVGFYNNKVVVNDSGEDIDFRIEGDNQENLFVADASLDRVGIGTANPADLLELQGAEPKLRFDTGTAFIQWHLDQNYFRLHSNSLSNILSLNYTRGFLGIGDVSPTETLSVTDDLAGFIGGFVNDGNADSRQGIFIQGCLDSSPSQACDFIQFRDGDGSILGAVEGNGSGGITYTSSGSDYAELFRGNRDQVAPGDILGINKKGKIEKAQYEQQKTRMIGVYSTNPNTLGNWKDNWEKSRDLVPVGLIGQLYVNVSNENGVIQKNDPIGVSKQYPGVGVKANDPQVIIGYALEEADGKQSQRQILIFVSPGWFNGDI